LTGRDARFYADRVPRWLRSPLPAGIMGLLVPGSGLLLVGAPRRAALAFLGFASMSLSLLVLWKSQWLWQLNAALLAGALQPTSLERLFLTAAAVAFAGGMIWVASVLDGMRCGFHAQGGPTSGLGDWMTFLLLIAVLAAYFGSEPKSIARDVHNYATSLEHEGMQLVPLQLARLAKRLDPARPRYTLHLASLLQQNGDMASAEILRGQMRSYWREYERLQEDTASQAEEESRLPSAALGAPASPTPSVPDLLPSPMAPPLLLQSVPVDSIAAPADSLGAPGR
jgi:hypothetical protein